MSCYINLETCCKIGSVTSCQFFVKYTQQKSSYVSYKANKKHLMESRWMIPFWYQTWRNRLIIWIETGTYVLKNCKWSHSTVQYRASDSWAALYVDKWKHLQFFISTLSLFKWLELCYWSTYSFKFSIKMKKTSTCFPWYAFNWPSMKHFWENWIFRSVQELFFA